MDFVRSFDQFGTQVSLNYAPGKTHYQTACGGCISFVFKALIFAYFLKQLLAMMDYADPAISSYQIMENREKMQKGDALNLGDYNVNFIFGFLNWESKIV